MANFPKGQDARQIRSRDILQQIFPYLSGQQLDLLLRSIDKDLQVPMRVDASSSPDLSISIGPGIVNNSVSGRQKSIPHIQNAIPAFTSGTITFPSANGGTITVSPGSNLTLTCPINNYVKVLISLDSSGQLIVSVGTPDPSEAAAVVPAPVSNCLPIAYVTLFNNAGTIDNVVQNKIYQFGGGGGSGGGSAQGGFAQEVPVPNDVNTITVVFPSTLPGVNYVPRAQLANYVDGTPQFQDVMVINKTTGGFTALWNANTDSANYMLSYIIPAVQEQIGEANVPSGANSLTIPLPIALAGTTYVVIAQLVDYSGESPQFQTVMPTARTDTDFTVEWNSPTDSANYKIAYTVALIQ